MAARDGPADLRMQRNAELAERVVKRARKKARRAEYARSANQVAPTSDHESDCRVSDELRRVRAGGRKPNIAILGGGVAGIATALYLTHPANPHCKTYDVTIYQQGWRIGGKCASGRNMDEHGRIEEHGLHILFGFYENTFRMLRDTMTEWKIPGGHPWATPRKEDRWMRAFTPTYNTSVVEPRPDKTWDRWDLNFPHLTGTPGDGEPARDDFLDFLDAALSWADAIIAMRDADPEDPDRGFRSWLESADHPSRRRIRAERRRQHRRLGLTSAIPIAFKIGALILKASVTVSPFGRRRRLKDLDANSKVRTAVDLIGALLWGLLWNSPFIYLRGLDVLDRYELREFLRRYGARAESVEAPIIDALYDSVFATPGGTSRRADENLAAGVALRLFFNITLGYKGAPLWKMNAGMGDTIFTPAYEVLKERGVEFRFFHRVTGVEVDGNRVTRVRVDRQADIVDPRNQQPAQDIDYQPLVSVAYRADDGKPFPEQLHCWPSTPDFNQLEKGKELKERGIDFENASTRECVEQLELRDGHEFDHVVLAIPSSAFPHICPDLMAANPSISRMVHELRHVSTQSYQAWLSDTLGGVGWQSVSPVFGNFVDPLNTWSDMSQVLSAEPVPQARMVAYFCGAMRDSASPKNLEGIAGELLNEMAKSTWRNALSTYGLFDRGLIVGEYFRTNRNPTDRYVLSVAGTTQYRLRADETGFENLTFAGDWTRNGLNAGAVEAAVTSAMQASNHISGYPLRADIVRDSGL